MKILVTGASGTVGTEVLKKLSGMGKHEITAFDVESNSVIKKLTKLQKTYNFSVVYGDLRQEKSIERVAKNKDAVIHLAAIIPPLADEKPDLAEAVNVGGTDKLLRAIEKYSPNAFFIYSSSVSVYGDRIHDPEIRVGDSLNPSPRDQYGITKIKAEEIIQNSSVNWTIFRLTAIMGDHKMGKLMFHMPLDTPMEICTPTDTARAFAKAIEHKEALNRRIFNLGGGEKCRISYREYLEKSFEIFGLGEVNFPDKSFSEKNFHCGHYADGDDLEEILHFRRDTIDTHFESLKSSVNPGIKFLTTLFRGVIKKNLLKRSEPFMAFQQQHREEMEHYFKVKSYENL